MKTKIKTKMIIDAHVHITSPNIIDSLHKYREKEPYFDLLCGSPKNKNVTAEELIKMMDLHDVDKAVVFGFGYYNQDICKEANDYTIEAVGRFPDRLLGFAVVNPGQKGLLAELARCKRAGLKGVGEIMPMGQQVDITDKQMMDTLGGFCRDAGWPMLVHVNEIVGHQYPGKTTDSIKEAQVLAENFPENDIIFAHLGGGLCFYETMPELRKTLSRVYYDTAALPFLYDKTIFKGLKEFGVMPKLVFGTDYPLLTPKPFRNRIEASNLTPPEKDAFFGGTMAKLLGL